jgi:pimeloyl-ACP methyl ester carboxylesterase
VTYQRPLNPAERQRLIDGGAGPREIAGETVGQTEPVAPSTLITLPTPSNEVTPIVSASGELNAFTLAVASAIDNADTAALALLARDPAALLDRMNWLRQDPRRWNQLTPLEQQLLIESLPDQIGSLNGLPIAARDRANRIVLDRTRAALQARLSYLRSLPEVTTPQPTPQPSPRPGGAPPTLLPADEIAQIESKLRGIEALERRLAGVPGRPQAYLVGLSGEGNGQAIVAIGDPDHADNVVTYVPGTGSSLGKISGDINRADAMALDAYGRSPGSRTAVITWVGYDAPQSLIEATSSSYADQGAGDLRSFQAGLGVSHVGGDANYTVVGHSYGSTVIGHAARAGDLGADNLVFVGSPGVGVDHASDLNIDPRHVYATVAANDPIQYGTVHGPDPTRPGFGAQPFASDAGSPSAHAHSEYWDVGNRSRANMAAIVTGHPELVRPPTPTPTPGPSPVAPR